MTQWMDGWMQGRRPRGTGDGHPKVLGGDGPCNKSVTFKFNLLLSLIMHTFSSGYLISIRSLSMPFARLVAGDPLTVGCLVTHFVAPSCLLCHRHLMPKRSSSVDLYTSTMNQLIDTTLPLRELKTRCRPLAVWFDSECHQIR